MLKSGTQLHALQEKYTPEFNDENHEEIYAALVNSTDIIEQKGIDILQQKERWFKNKEVKIEINNIPGYNKFYGNQITPYHNHEFYEINYVLEGTLVQYINHKKIVMHTGDLLLISPDVKHANYPTKNTKAYNILIQSAFIKEIERHLAKFDPFNYLLYVQNNSAFVLFCNTANMGVDSVVHSFITLKNLEDKTNAFSNTLYECLAKQILLLLSKCERLDYTCYSHHSNIYISEKSNIILDYIKVNYATISMEELSTVFGYTPQHLRRIIEKVTGNNFTVLVQMHRINHAKTLIASTNIAINEICRIVGIESTEYFSRWFKYQTGKTPSAYRAEMRKKS